MARAADDPLAAAIAPPPNEAPAEQAARLAAEAEAKRISDQIDDMLNKERASEKRSKPLRILLLGQSESGKSTTLKNFQLMYAPRAFKAERASWRAVIQLNLVKSIHAIVDALTAAEAQASKHKNDGTDDEPRGDRPRAHPPLGAQQRTLRLRVLPLLQVEDQLLKALAAPGEVEAVRRTRERELSVAPTWLARLLGGAPGGAPGADDQIDFADPRDPGRVIHACRDDMMALWADPVVRAVLRAQNVTLEDTPGFFLNDLPRLTERRYIPTDDDVLRCRLKTLGVSEFQFRIESTSASGQDWRIYDVGGARSQRLFWAPFFDQVDAIIFLAPMSCFDQQLAEDRTANRLEDSVALWKEVCGNKLLENVQIVLFMNKIDLLRAKLASGVQFTRYVTTYGTRPNDAESCLAYLKRKFAAIQKELSPVPRQFMCHYTSLTDITTTQTLLARVGDIVVRANLKDSSLI